MKWFAYGLTACAILFLSVLTINCFYGTLFPIKYEREILYASEKYSVDSALIFAVINTESGFRKNVKSSKGAEGLMQIMPSTAQEISSKVGLKEFDLFNEQDNIMLGTFYLANLIEKFGDLRVALCAYNAGPANVEKWLKNEEYSDDGKILKKIPFSETKKYIQKINKNLKYYSKKINTKSIFARIYGIFTIFI